MGNLQAKARNPAKGMEGIIAVIAPWLDGEYRTHMVREGGMPFGSSAPETVDQAKARCQRTMGIQPDEWEEHEGEPFWLPIPRGAFEDAVSKFPSEDEGETPGR
jgi:hypothetical protein